jgi:hypothetical protein
MQRCLEVPPVTFERCDYRLLHGWHRSQVKNAVAVFEQLLQQDVVTRIALDELQFVSWRAPG